MTSEEMWRMFCAESDLDPTTHYEAWAFGGAPDELARLTCQGIKTGTASAYALYELEGEPTPRVGDYSVVLDSRDHAVCVIRDTRCYVAPFREVTADHAWKEGEGDRSLAYWRMVHEDFFKRELAGAGLAFDENCPVFCEEFEVVYCPEKIG